MNEAYVYVLYCNDQTLYTGYSTDVINRFLTHQKKKGSKYTKIAKRHPLKICYIAKYNDKSSALRAEYAFKQLTRKQKINLIKQQQSKSLQILKNLPTYNLIQNDDFKFL